MVYAEVGVPPAPPVATIAIDHQLQSGQREYTRQHSGPTHLTPTNPPDDDDVDDDDNYQDSHQYVQQKTNESQPAFDGAKHDVNGFCIRHGKVRMCHPVYDGMNDGVNKEPIKFRTVRKFCPSCGMHQQHNSNSKKYNRGKVPHFPSRKLGTDRKESGDKKTVENRDKTSESGDNNRLLGDNKKSGDNKKGEDKLRSESRGKDRVKKNGDRDTGKKDGSKENSTSKDKKKGNHHHHHGGKKDEKKLKDDETDKQHLIKVKPTQNHEKCRETKANENTKDWCEEIKQKKEKMRNHHNPPLALTDTPSSTKQNNEEGGNKEGGHAKNEGNKQSPNTNYRRHRSNSEGDGIKQKTATEGGIDKVQRKRLLCWSDKKQNSSNNSKVIDGGDTVPTKGSESEKENAQLITASSRTHNHLRKSKSATDVQQTSQATNPNSSDKDCNATKTHSITRGPPKKHIVAGATDLPKTNNLQHHAHAIDVTGGKPATVVQWEDASASQCVSRFTTTRHPTTPSSKRPISGIVLAAINEVHHPVPKQNQARRRVRVRSSSIPRSWKEIPKETTARKKQSQRQTVVRREDDDDNRLHKRNSGGDIPLPKSPNVPRYTIKCSRSSSEDDNDNGSSSDSERPTGVYMMAAGLNLPSFDDAKDVERGINDHKKGEGKIDQPLATSTTLVVKEMKRPASSVELRSRLRRANTAPSRKKAEGNKKEMSTALVVKKMKRPASSGELRSSLHHIRTAAAPREEPRVVSQALVVKHVKRAHSNDGRYNSLARDPPSGNNDDSSKPITSSQLPIESIMGKLMSNHQEVAHKDDSCGKTKARRKLKSQFPEAPGKDASPLPSNLIMDKLMSKHEGIIRKDNSRDKSKAHKKSKCRDPEASKSQDTSPLPSNCIMEKLMSNPEGKSKDASHEKSKARRKPKSQDPEASSKQGSSPLPSELIMNKLMSSHENNYKDSSNNKAKTQNKPNSQDAKVSRVKEASPILQNHSNDTSNNDAKDLGKPKTRDDQEAPGNKKEASNDKAQHDTTKFSHDNHAKEQRSSSRDNPRGCDSRTGSNSEVSESGKNLNKIMEKHGHVRRGNTKEIAKKSSGSAKKDDHAKQLKKCRDKPLRQSLKKKETKKNVPGAKDGSEVKKKGSSVGKGKDGRLKSRGRSKNIETKSVQFKSIRRGKSLHSHTNRNDSAEDHTNAKRDKDDKKRVNQRSKSLPQRGQRQRLTCEHHVTTKPITTMSTYRNIFSELAQGSVFMVKDIVVPR